MKKLACLAMLLGIALFATGCPQGPETPSQPQIDVGAGEVPPEVPTEEGPAEEAAETEPAAEESMVPPGGSITVRSGFGSPDTNTCREYWRSPS